MISAVSSYQPVQQTVAAQPAGKSTPQAAVSKSALPTDTVELSPAAMKALAGGDADHDGDSR